MKTAYDIILEPVISEQSMDVAQDKKYTFKVATDANKTQVKLAVEEIFGVEVARVNIMNYDGKVKRMRVHILVAIYFVKNNNPDLYNIVNHKDGDKSHNIYTNLEWCDTSYNTKHAYVNGLINIKNFKDINSSQATPYIVKYKNDELLFPTQKTVREYFNVGKTVFKSEKFRKEKEREGYIITKITKEEYETKKAQRPS